MLETCSILIFMYHSHILLSPSTNVLFVSRFAAQHGLIVNPAKCQFGRTTIDFVGHRVTKDRVVPLPSKVDTVAPAYSMQEFLSMVNFYHRFIPGTLYEALNSKAPKHLLDWSVERRSICRH